MSQRENVKRMFMFDEGFAFEYVLSTFKKLENYRERDDLLQQLLRMPPDEIQMKALAIYDILFGTEGSDA